MHDTIPVTLESRAIVRLRVGVAPPLARPAQQRVRGKYRGFILFQLLPGDVQTLLLTRRPLSCIIALTVYIRYLNMIRIQTRTIQVVSHLKRLEHEDHYDHNTSFNPFQLGLSAIGSKPSLRLCYG